ncbi:phosphate ABC transporter permease [Comamonas testosteroni]|uniref:Phosphate ABC transporter permease n=1 Tax=Comamonas testosteroni TaxID=285 RepID=A0A096GDW3_COMTE|nr:MULTISPECIES: phosphonate ABC transporter, permease protein PhnE [Comamonas]KGH23360.1 phosphate ABC transporter permease [Comamonas testosteroni]KOC21005.1 phosphate ABC transporter permease [Comamonas testosteroni]KWT66947.1 Phosphonate ABC transporter permease protein phnE [Comamonas testosteroni]MDN5507630.1 phosphonate ABC transporter, permease protein PhnE [Comamonas sp.]MDN5538468.1 phosphonate ABC transporter, permease protein PhnE [Comamonas sp.]
MSSHSLKHTPDRWQWTAARPQGKSGWLGYAALALVIAWVLQWSAAGAQMSWSELAGGMPQIGDFLSRSVPPDWSMLPRLWAPALETIQIAIWGTLLSVILALPLSFVAAGNLHGWHWLRRITRQFLNVIRSINELILALVFVSAVGLGPFPGVLALALHGMGMLAKFFAEAIEEIDDGPLQALRSAGASQLQIIAFGVVPQVITAWIAVVLYRFEVNLRSATVLGMVGAGGLGFELVSSLKLFRYQETATCIIVITVMVIAADMASNWLRSRIQQGARH